MRLLLHSASSGEENLAIDEALLEGAESSATPREVLRLWEPTAPLVVVGRSSHLDVEVNEPVCAERAIPILRRASGGAAIVTGPGCLMYAVVLSVEARPELASIDAAHRFVLETLVVALAPLVGDIRHEGTCDLTLDGRKFSGNSLRVRRRNVLYHGTLLYDFPLELIGACLKQPPRQPEYRVARAHADFVTNLPIGHDALVEALVAGWHAVGPADEPDPELVARLIEEKYGQASWNRKY